MRARRGSERCRCPDTHGKVSRAPASCKRLLRERPVAGQDGPDVMEAFNEERLSPLSHGRPGRPGQPAGSLLRRSLPSGSNMFAGLINKKINLIEAETYQSYYRSGRKHMSVPPRPYGAVRQPRQARAGELSLTLAAGPPAHSAHAPRKGHLSTSRAQRSPEKGTGGKLKWGYVDSYDERGSNLVNELLFGETSWDSEFKNIANMESSRCELSLTENLGKAQRTSCRVFTAVRRAAAIVCCLCAEKRIDVLFQNQYKHVRISLFKRKNYALKFFGQMSNILF